MSINSNLPTGLGGTTLTNPNLLVENGQVPTSAMGIAAPTVLTATPSDGFSGNQGIINPQLAAQTSASPLGGQGVLGILMQVMQMLVGLLSMFGLGGQSGLGTPSSATSPSATGAPAPVGAPTAASPSPTDMGGGYTPAPAPSPTDMGGGYTPAPTQGSNPPSCSPTATPPALDTGSPTAASANQPTPFYHPGDVLTDQTTGASYVVGADGNFYPVQYSPAPAPTPTGSPTPTGTASPASTPTASPAPTATGAPAPTPTASPAPTPAADYGPSSSSIQAASDALKADGNDNGKFMNRIRQNLGYGGDYKDGLSVSDLNAFIKKGDGSAADLTAATALVKALPQGTDRFSVNDLNVITGDAPATTPTATGTPTPTATAGYTPTATGTPTPTATAGYTPTATGTPTPTATAGYTPTATVTASPAPTPTGTAGVSAQYASPEDAVRALEVAAGNGAPDGKIGVNDLTAIRNNTSLPDSIRGTATTLMNNFADDSTGGWITADSLRASAAWSGKAVNHDFKTDTKLGGYPGPVSGNGDLLYWQVGDAQTDGNLITATAIPGSPGKFITPSGKHIYVGPEDGNPNKSVIHYEDPNDENTANTNYRSADLSAGTNDYNPSDSGNRGEFLNQDMINSFHSALGLTDNRSKLTMDQWNKIANATGDPGFYSKLLSSVGGDGTKVNKMIETAKYAIDQSNGAGTADITKLEQAAGNGAPDGLLGKKDLSKIMATSQDPEIRKLAYYLQQNFGTFTSDKDGSGNEWITPASLTDARIGMAGALPTQGEPPSYVDLSSIVGPGF